jgi:ABC-type xylose transport system permease subunit
MNLNLIEVCNAIATLVLVAILAWAKVRERRMTKAAGLENNPERCEIHSVKIAVIIERLDRIDRDITEIIKRLP